MQSASVGQGFRAACCPPAQQFALARANPYPTGLWASPLQGASALASADRSAGGQHVVRNPCYTLARGPEKCTLAPVQLPNLGSFIRRYDDTFKVSISRDSSVSVCTNS